jgi:hypothetical protein
MPLQITRMSMFVLCVALGFGCASAVDEHWGESYASLTEQMIIDPEAGAVPDDGVSELQGTTVEGVMSRYRREQEKPPDKTFLESVLEAGMTSGN